MGHQPLLDLVRVMNLGIVGHDRELGKEGPRQIKGVEEPLHI